MTTSALPTRRFLDEAKSLACVHCGLCLGACPTYLETGNENDSPRGRIYIMRALEQGRLALADAAVRHVDLCLGCRACEVACPSGVQYGQLLEAAREHIEERFRRSAFQTFLRRVAIEEVFPFPARMKPVLWAARLARKLGLEPLFPKFAREALTLVPQDTSADGLPEVSPAATTPLKGRVGFIQGCVMSVMFGRTNAASVQLLNRAGYEVLTPPGQTCCGALYAHTGVLERARQCARRNIALFESLNLDAIIINAAGCGSTLKEYGHLLREDAPWAERAQQFSAKVKDLTEWLKPRDFKSQISNLKFITYHDACHLAHPQRITQPPRDLIRAVAGESFVELPESDVCCGSAGSYNLTEPEMAERLQRRKIGNILKTGAQIVVTTNPGCLLQIRAGLQKAGASRVHVLHIADFLLERINKNVQAP
ncbi:MAG: (Fe-S)-binding protein [Verrucomicrobia bacterium]|nr:(Fe-S)-binding protein [Verrucomicrobiota bacterium]